MLKGLIERFVLFTATVRRAVVRFLRARLTGPCGVLLALPVKTLACLNFVGTVSIVFSTTRRMDAGSFGGACCSLAMLCVQLGTRVDTDEEMATTFADIMTGTLRQKRKTLHDLLTFSGAGLACIGAAVDISPRVLGVAGEEANVTDALAGATLAALALRLYFARPFDGEDPLHVAYDLLLHDVGTTAQASAIVTRGASSFLTFLVASSLFGQFAANTAQLCRGLGEDGEQTEDQP
eukprot:CAMPEP_0119279252 /NCGR_PEP_ID=MMETSP1329-20130426/20468_1 /TAXON_ID=114041 /ORGANISM="Genus nov. species nov., Strain RCC1024" /LENGTH=235 /DNA_ID=CAMNT_0007279789 /DNA_START=206 /DNA_END=909 /DNA_ORIENTATION=+